MAEIRSYPFFRHLRAEPTRHVILSKNGKTRRSGPGLAFWFSPLGASIVEIPLDDRELPFVFRGRSSDFQDVAVNAGVVWRSADPELLGTRFDFAVNPRTGGWNRDPLEKVASAIAGRAQELAAAFFARTPLRQILDEGVESVRRVIHGGLVADTTLAALGIEIVSTTVASIAPSAEMEKALQTPMRERIQQGADQATFERRALAVEKERAIQENELSTRIELARREETLIAQTGANERRRASDNAEAAHIAAVSQAESLALLETAKNDAEKTRMAIYRDLPTAALFGLAANELAGKLQTIEHVTLTPDMIGDFVQKVLQRRSDA